MGLGGLAAGGGAAAGAVVGQHVLVGVAGTESWGDVHRVTDVCIG